MQVSITLKKNQKNAIILVVKRAEDTRVFSLARHKYKKFFGGKHMSTTQKKILNEEIREVFKILESACKEQGLSIREAFELLDEETEELSFKEFYKKNEGTTAGERYVRSMSSLSKKEKVIIWNVLQIMNETVGCPFSTEIVEQLNLRLSMAKMTYGKLEIHEISAKFLKEYFRREGIKEPLDFNSWFAVRFKLSEVAKQIMR